VVHLLVERGADPAIGEQQLWWTPLMVASVKGHLEVVRWLLGHPGAGATINQQAEEGGTVPWWACLYARGVVVRALLESGADPTIASNNGLTPVAVAKLSGAYREGITAEGRRECAEALEVRYPFPLP
jgi:ankyrin repeat protein